MPNQTQASTTAVSTCRLIQMQGWCSPYPNSIHSSLPFSRRSRHPSAPQSLGGQQRRRNVPSFLVGGEDSEEEAGGAERTDYFSDPEAEEREDKSK